VSIIAYRDPELLPTLRSLFSQAAQPARIVAGIVWQGDDTSTGDVDTLAALDTFAAEYAGCIRQLRLPHTEARGPCYARALAQQRLFEDEPFYLQLDSHMRFARGWDEQLLQQWALCKDSNAVLSTYPPAYERSSDAASELSSADPAAAASLPPEEAQQPSPPTILCASKFDAADGMLRIVGRLLSRCPSAPLPSALFAAGFAFGPGRLVRAAPYDPHLANLFFGEESSMLARLYTAGFNMFAPSRTLVWHCWSRAYRHNFRELAQQADPDTQRQHKRRELLARARVCAVLGMTPTAEDSAVLAAAVSEADSSDASLSSSLAVPRAPYTVGTQRTLSDFYAHTGVDFSTRSISERGRNGGVSPSLFRQQASDAAQHQLDMVMRIMQQQKLAVSSST